MAFSEAGWFAQGEKEHHRTRLQASWQEAGSLDVEGIDPELKLQFIQDKLAEIKQAQFELLNARDSSPEQLRAAMEKVSDLDDKKRVLETLYGQYEDPVAEQLKRQAILEKYQFEPAPTPLHSAEQPDAPVDLGNLVRFLQARERAAAAWRSVADRAAAAAPEEFAAAREQLAQVITRPEELFEKLDAPVKQSLEELGLESDEKMTELAAVLRDLMGEDNYQDLNIYAGAA